MTAHGIAALLGGTLIGDLYLAPGVGRWAPTRHTAKQHDWIPIAFTLDPDAPISLLTGCLGCAAVETVTPRRRLRKLREGFTPEQWTALIDENERRVAEAKLAEAA